MWVEPSSDTNAIGLLAATVAALFWATAVVLYRRVGRVMPPVRLNFIKGLIASGVLGAVVLVDWQVRGNQPWSMSGPMLAIMAISGLIGIGVGDTFFFAGLNRMGSRRMLLMFTINPVFTVVVAWLWLDEPMTIVQLLGVGLTCGGVAWVIAERNTGKSDGHVDVRGVIYGVGAAGCQSIGVLVSRYVFDQGQMTAVASAWLRITAGAMGLCLFLRLDRRLGDAGGADHLHPRAPSPARAMVMLGVAMLLGTILGIWLMQVSVKQSNSVGVASTLLSTSPLFILPIAAALGERISIRAVLGAAVTVGGVGLLYLCSG